MIAVGDVFGELTVGRYLGYDHRDLPVWLCRCACGGAAIRTAGALRASVARGHVPCCARCHRELCSGKLIERHEEHVLWDMRGTLWSEGALSRIESDIRDAVAEELGGFAYCVDLPVEVVEPEEGTAGDEFKDRDGSAEAYLHEIGAAFGVSRERARQLVLRALCAFAVAWSKMFPRDPLSFVLYGEDGKRESRGRAVISMVEIDAALERAKAGFEDPLRGLGCRA